MTEHQYQRALQNRRPYFPAPLFSSPVSAIALRRAARRLRRRQAVEAVLERVLPAEALRRVRVAMSGEHGVDLHTRCRRCAETLRRRRTELQRQLQRSVAGVNRLRINPSLNAEAEYD
ncbi:MAG: hypothetical protein D6744_18120 [Planctomycetota bacterium]|nr:MAG: hypothetical protein D6744_18120 [Planctomycetota bacterium]